MHSLKQVIINFLFREADARTLALLRCLLFGWLTIQTVYFLPVILMPYPAEMWRPVAMMLWSPGPPPHRLVFLAVLLLIFSSFCATIGLRTRITMSLTVVLSCFVFGVTGSYGLVNVHVSPLILAAAVFMFSRAGDALSIDSRVKHGSQVVVPPAAGTDYGWPIQLTKMILVSLIFAAGFRKCTGSWPGQASECISVFLQYKYHIHSTPKNVESMAHLLVLADYQWICALLGYGVLIIETGSPLALLGNRWLTCFFIGGFFLMQLWLTLAAKTFLSFPWLAMYCFWLPWDSWLNRKPKRH